MKTYKNQFYVVLIFFFSVISCYSQKTERNPLHFSTTVFSGNKTQLVFAAPFMFSQRQKPFTIAFKPQKLPVFCQLEVDLHSHFNVWMVLRAGNDEDYKKLIRQNNP